MSTHIQPKQSQLAFMKELPIDKPVVMINLLKFKKRTEDGKTTGQERYLEYSQKVMPFLQESGGEIMFMSKSFSTLIGPENENWDHVVLVKYPNIGSFFKMIQSKDYPHTLRSSALEDSRLIPCIQ